MLCYLEQHVIKGTYSHTFREDAFAGSHSFIYTLYVKNRVKVKDKYGIVLSTHSPVATITVTVAVSSDNSNMKDLLDADSRKK